MVQRAAPSRRHQAHPLFPLIIAHRGASRVAPESTHAAIRAAVRSGAQMIELDVQMTREGRLIIFHDDRLERTTDGAGRVRHMRYANLARLDAGSWFDRRFAKERILLVSQALGLVPQRMWVNLELKRTPHRRALVQHLQRLLRRIPVRHPRLLISSVDPRLLRPLRHTSIPLALICPRRPDQSLRQAVRLGVSAWHPKDTLVTPARIAHAHAHGLRVHAWTVDDPARARRLLGWGVDGVFTNDPAGLAQRLGRYRP